MKDNVDKLIFDPMTALGNTEYQVVEREKDLIVVQARTLPARHFKDEIVLTRKQWDEYYDKYISHDLTNPAKLEKLIQESK